MRHGGTLFILAALLLSCGGGSGTSSPPASTTAPAGTPPVLLSIQPDPAWAGQYLLNYLPSSAGTYGNSGITYIPEIKSATFDWQNPNSMIFGVFDTSKQIPLNLDLLPEGMDLSVRIQMAAGGLPLPAYLSNTMALTTLPFPPLFSGGYDTGTGMITGPLTNRSKIPHTFLFEITPLDAQGNPLGWQPMTLVRQAQNANQSTSPDDLLVALEFPAGLERLPVLMRAKTVAGSLIGIPSPTAQATLGLAVPTHLSATSDAAGIHLSWTNNSKLATSIAVFRFPGRFDDVSGLNQPIATLTPDTTQFTDLPPVGGDYRYYLQVADGVGQGACPTIRTQTADSLTGGFATAPVMGYLPLLREPNGNLVTTAGSTLWESDAAGNPVARFDFTGGGNTGGSHCATLDANGMPHLIYQTFESGAYRTRHAWKAGSTWQDELLPVNIGLGSMFCDGAGQLWIVTPETTAGTGPMKFDILRGSPGAWISEVITSPAGTVPTLYSTDQFEAVASDGTLSLAFTSGASQYLIQRHPDGSLTQATIPFVPAPENAAKSIPVCGLAAGADSVLRLVRADGGLAPCIQTFDGTTFTPTEVLPIPSALNGTHFSGLLPPVLSTSGGKLGWILRSGSYTFLGLKSASGWAFSALDISSSSVPSLSGFQGESFWVLRTEGDPLTGLSNVMVEFQP